MCADDEECCCYVCFSLDLTILSEYQSKKRFNTAKGGEILWHIEQGLLRAWFNKGAMSTFVKTTAKGKRELKKY